MGVSAEVLGSTSPAYQSPRGPAMGLYTTYLDLFSRRLKRGQATPKPDAAGLLYGSKYHGRTTPLKGKGAPPADDKEEGAARTRLMIPGRSNPVNRDLLDHPEPSPTSPTASPRAVTRRMQYTNFLSQLTSGGVEVKTEPPPARAYRRPGSAAPTHNTARVIVTGLEADDDVGPTSDVSAPTTPRTPRDADFSSRYLTERYPNEDHFSPEPDMSFVSRPRTAPSAMSRSTEARRTYLVNLEGHNGVFEHRYNGDLGSPEVMGGRPVTPQNSVPDAFAARNAYQESRQSYNVNKMRSLLSHARYA